MIVITINVNIYIASYLYISINSTIVSSHHRRTHQFSVYNMTADFIVSTEWLFRGGKHSIRLGKKTERKTILPPRYSPIIATHWRTKVTNYKRGRVCPKVQNFFVLHDITFFSFVLLDIFFIFVQVCSRTELQMCSVLTLASHILKTT